MGCWAQLTSENPCVTHFCAIYLFGAFEGFEGFGHRLVDYQRVRRRIVKTVLWEEIECLSVGSAGNGMHSCIEDWVRAVACPLDKESKKSKIKEVMVENDDINSATRAGDASGMANITYQKP
eukprot:4751574-Amphidinium_carterae.1